MGNAAEPPEHRQHGAPVVVFHEAAERLDAEQQLSHTEQTLSYTAKGTVFLEHGRTLKVSAGSVTLVPAGVPYRVTGGHDVEVWGIGFSPANVGLDEEKALMRAFRRVRLGALPIIDMPSARAPDSFNFFAIWKRSVRAQPKMLRNSPGVCCFSFWARCAARCLRSNPSAHPARSFPMRSPSFNNAASNRSRSEMSPRPCTGPRRMSRRR